MRKKLVLDRGRTGLNLPRAPLPKQRCTVDKVKTKIQPRQEKYKNNDHEDDGA